MQLFISHLASWLRTRRFSKPTFRPSGATNHWKNTVLRDFPTFSRICIFFLLIFSLLTLLTSAFQLSILSEVSLLNFLRRYSSCSYWFAMLCDFRLVLTCGWSERRRLIQCWKKLTLWHGNGSSQNRRQVFRNIFPSTHTEHRCGCVWAMWNLFWFFRFAIAFLLPLHYL